MKSFSEHRHTTDVLCYSISLDKIQNVSSFNSMNQGGLALQASDGKSIYYFGGEPNRRRVYKFNSETNLNVELPTVLPSPVFFAGGVANNGTIFIFNGREGKVLEFNEISETATIIGDLPFQAGTSTYSTTAIPNGQNGV
jgi:hypothetical protein